MRGVFFDEDHPWVVVTTDAPLLMFELLVEEYDGWARRATTADHPVGAAAVTASAPSGALTPAA